MAHNRKKPKGTKNARLAAKRAERLRNTGPDESGRYGVNPYAARGHVVEIAPKELRDNPNSTQFPKRIATQRMIDRYRKCQHITEGQYEAARALLHAWDHAGFEARLCAAYDPDAVSGGHSPDAAMVAKMDGGALLFAYLDAVPRKCRGVVRAVVFDETSASAWARKQLWGKTASKAHGLYRLRQGLQALAQHLGT